MTINKEGLNKKREYLRFLTTNIFKLTSKKRTLERQLLGINQKLKSYTEEREEIATWTKNNSFN